MKQFDFDLFVIGAGSGGVRAARMSAGFGARVAIAEERYLGGTCVNVGCVPKKLFVYASGFFEEFNAAKHFGWSQTQPSFDWQRLIQNKNKEIDRLNGIYRKLLLEAGAILIDDRAKLIDQHTVAVDNRQVTAKRILIATGGWPTIPKFPGKEYVISSNEAFFLEEIPTRAIIVGGGYIAVEFAGIFNGLGVDTTLVYRGPLFLRGFDHDIRQHLANEMIKKGITLKFESNIKNVRKNSSGLVASFASGDEQATDLIMYATGRSPNTSKLGLERLGVELDHNGAINVNEEYQSSVSSIYAIGDVTDRINLTPVAVAEGMALAKSLYAQSPTRLDYANIPSCVFSQPNIGTVGLPEDKARQQFEQIEIYKSKFKPLKHTLTDIDEILFMKLVVDKKTDRVVGVHMVGPNAGEIMQGVAIALKAGASKAVFDSTIGIHPTAAEEFVTMRVPAED